MHKNHRYINIIIKDSIHSKVLLHYLGIHIRDQESSSPDLRKNLQYISRLMHVFRKT
jgi:hypothetical protein